MAQLDARSGSPTSHRPLVRLDPQPLLAQVPYLGYGLSILGGLVFAIIALNVRVQGPLLTWDTPIVQALHIRARHDFILDFYAMRFSSTLGRETAAIITVLLAVYWLWKRQWRPFTLLLAGVFGGEIWFETLSRLFARQRPSFPDPLDPLSGPGFPSGHSMTAVTLYGLLLYLLLPRLRSWRWRLLAVVDAAAIMLLIGYSRLYMGNHYPTDVLAGYAFGLFWSGLVYTSIELYYRRHPSEAAS